MADLDGTSRSPSPGDPDAETEKHDDAQRVPVGMRKTLQTGVPQLEANTPPRLDEPSQPSVVVEGEPQQPTRSPRYAKLGRTLRMELKLGSLPVPSEPGSSDSDFPRPNGPHRGGSDHDRSPLVFGDTQRMGDPRSGEFSSGRQPAIGNGGGNGDGNPLNSILSGFQSQPYAQGGAGGGGYDSQSPHRRDNRDHYADNQPRRKREPRPGERTMVMARQRRKTNIKDWMFVIALVGTLGVTASMLLFQNEGPDYSDDTGEEANNAATDPTDPSIPLAIQQPQLPPHQQQPQQPQTPAPVAAPAIRATELRSDPPGAEVAVGGAVVGNTPVRVARSDQDVDYVLRQPGYEQQVIRVGSQSPATIAVTLRRSVAQAP